MNNNDTVPRIIPLTDTAGRILPGARDSEPNPGSVVLSEGEFGHAWQRHFSDGLWYPTRGGRGRSWSRMLMCRNLVLVYSAAKRGDQ